MSAPLPDFPYHPDPVRTGSVRISDATCLCCGRQRGYIYVAPVFAVDEYDEAICPWCIADGSAAERFGAEFTDVGVASEAARRAPVTPSVRSVRRAARRYAGARAQEDRRPRLVDQRGTGPVARNDEPDAPIPCRDRGTTVAEVDAERVGVRVSVGRSPVFHEHMFAAVPDVPVARQPLT